ncbi:MAG TPA: lysophospholipid acyltransferase family protein [Gemmataceae bacterium]|nr:lysophospholipid acyltransferase family protein [Gemmataceae bacterium]
MGPRLSNLLYDALRPACFAALTFGFSFRSEGGGNLPPTGPALLIANHQSWWDPVLVGVASPRRLCFLARKTLFVNPALVWLMRTLNASPVDQEGFAREGLRTVLGHFDAGRAVLIFPEGQRTWDGKIGPLMPGVTLLIKKGQVPVVPVGIAGAFEAWPRWARVPTPCPLFLPATRSALAVSVGRPVDGRRYADWPREAILADLAKELHDAWERAKRLQRKA